MSSETAINPEVMVEQVLLPSQSKGGLWSVAWNIRNLGQHPLRLVAAQLPHGKFKSDRMNLQPPLEIAPGATVPLQVLVKCDAPARTVIENAFVILHVTWRAQAWRIFVRFTVHLDEQGVPGTVTERVSTQRVGASA